MALLAFPVAKSVSKLLNRAEAQLAALIDRMVSARQSAGRTRRAGRPDPALAAEGRTFGGQHQFHFGAAAAYYSIVQQRIVDLKETRVSGYPTIKGFMERRLAPALNTCAAISRRQEDLSARIARTSQLLRTSTSSWNARTRRC